MAVSLTELRQRLFELADQVVDTGEPLIVLRRGVRLRLVREDAAVAEGGRLARLTPQSVVIGPPLLPEESPSAWVPDAALRVAEPSAPWPRATRRRSKPSP
ncbi:MAG TPA: hypothetical protein VGC55_04470 [Dokdonella sp.]